MEEQPKRLWIHLVLLAATLVTTTFVGLDSSLGRQNSGVSPTGPGLAFWLNGLSYSLSIMAILFAHEMGHYLESRRRGVDASLPYFIPFIGAFGTLGAFIRMRLEKVVPSDSLIRIGAYGPIAGFLVTLPLLAVGLVLSDIRPAPDDLETGIVLGDSLILMAMEFLFVPPIPEGHDVWLHPMAYAGWAGLFVTALNLLPIGQLDGGHITYCLFGERANRVAPVLFLGLVAMGVAVFTGWLVFAGLVFLIGIKHPPICPDVPVRGRGRVVGWMTLALLVLCFTPQPFVGFPTLLELIGL